MFYNIARTAVYLYLRIFYKVEIIGKENIPSDGGILICANHGSNLDPLVIAGNIKRPINYLGKKELFKNKFAAYWMKKMRVFPLDRENTDMNAFRFTIDLLKSGGAVGIFAQGTRVKEGEEADIKSGVALFALKADALVVPMGIISNYKLFSKIRVRIGRPIKLSEYKNVKLRTEKLNEISGMIMDEVNKLVKEG